MLEPKRRMLRDQLRDARAVVLKDAEGFPQIFFAVERLAVTVRGKQGGLGLAKDELTILAADSPLANAVPIQHRAYHTPFGELYDHVRQARNDALHDGASARHLAQHAVELCLVLEDALVSHGTVVGDFMVRAPVCAELWHPVSFVRQQMLANAFSFLPIRPCPGGWCLVADLAIARFLRRGKRAIRLACTMEEAVNKHGLELQEAQCVHPETSVGHVLGAIGGQPLLITDSAGNLIGILTAFDLL